MAEMGTTPTMEPTMTAPQDTATAANTQNADEMAPTAPETVPAAMETQPTTPEVPADEGQATEERPSLNLNLNVPADNELAFWKTRGSLNPNEDVVYYWTGHIFLSQDADPNAAPVSDFPGPIMQFEGFNIARFEKVPGGIRMVSREMSLYKDMTGRILNCLE